MTINTIIEKINELKKNCIEVAFDNEEEISPEYITEITLTYEEDTKSVLDELIAELAKVAVEFRPYADCADFVFECEDGNAYEIDLFFVEREPAEEDECIGEAREPWGWML